MKPVTNRRLAPAKDSLDFYPTPEWATKALLDAERFNGKIWEPAAGNGAMVKVIKEFGYQVHASDIVERNYALDTVDDFLQSDRQYAQNVVTNPPFNIAEAFIHKALSIPNLYKCAFLLKLSFLEGRRRANSLYGIYPPDRVHVFSSRVTMYKDGAEQKGSGTQAYAWFVWEAPFVPKKTELRWIKGVN